MRWHNSTVENLEENYRELCHQFLPVSSENWHSTAHKKGELPTQGWKLHVSATVLSAAAVLARIGPVLTAKKINFKAVHSLKQLLVLNHGLTYGYSQIGKAFTIYPKDEATFVLLAHEIHQLTCDLPLGPKIPSDVRYSGKSNVYFRYGSFSAHGMSKTDQNEPTIVGPDGKLLIDSRKQETAIPSWLTNPLGECGYLDVSDRWKLKSIFPFASLSQRGKGGVYLALCCAKKPALCILKEGRKNGETDWLGRDGAWRIRREAKIIRYLAKQGVPVPRVQRCFNLGSSTYLAMDLIDGKNLANEIESLGAKLNINSRIGYCYSITEIVAKIHSAGYSWRDCKPHNFIITNNNGLFAIDFEGATCLGASDPLPWGTAAYSAPEAFSLGTKRDNQKEDIYSLAKTWQHVLTGKLPTKTKHVPAGSLDKIPAKISKLLTKMLHELPERRPSSSEIMTTLQQI